MKSLYENHINHANTRHIRKDPKATKLINLNHSKSEHSTPDIDNHKSLLT